MAESVKPFKLLLVGNIGCGKSSFVDRIKTGKFDHSYTPTGQLAVNRININTNLGTYSFNVWEKSSTYTGEKLNEYAGADCAIIMFDLIDNLHTILRRYYYNIRKMNGDIPIVLVWSKNDVCGECKKNILLEILVKDNDYANKSLSCYEVSSMTGVGLLEPLLHLLRRTIGVVPLETHEKTDNKPTETLIEQPTHIPDTHDLDNKPKTNILNNVNNVNHMNHINLKNGIIMDIVSKHMANIDYHFSRSLIIRAHPSIISSIAKQIVDNTEKVVSMYIPLNYKLTTNFGVCFVEYRESISPLVALDHEIIKSLEKEYSFNIKECDGVSNGRYERLIISLVVDDDIFEYAETRMITVKGLPVMLNNVAGVSRILLLKQMLNSIFSKYGVIVHSYLPLNDDKLSTTGHYVIEYDSNANIQRVINNENGKCFGDNILAVSRFNDTI